MSHVLNASVAPFCHSQDRLGSVAVPVFDQTAGFAHEDTDSQRQAVLAAFRSLPAVYPQASHRKVRSPSPSGCLVLAKHSEHVMVV